MCLVDDRGCGIDRSVYRTEVTHNTLNTLYSGSVTFGSEWVRTSKNESRVSRDLASAYVLCLRTFVVPILQRDEGKSLGKKE